MLVYIKGKKNPEAFSQSLIYPSVFVATDLSQSFTFGLDSMGKPFM
jgi:hypothetical protein